MQKRKYVLLFAGVVIVAVVIFLFSQKKLLPSQTNVFEVPQTAENEENEEASPTANPIEETPTIKLDDQQIEEKQESPAQELTEPAPASQNLPEKKPEDSADFVKQRLVSWGFQKSSSRKIDTIVIHSSYDALGDEPYDLDGLLDEYKQYGVAAHYLIDRKGIVYQLVEDENIAYHAGISSVPDGRTNVNFFSIGIELMNTKEDEYTSKQYNSLKELLAHLQKKYSIKYTLGHDDVAPGRKTDPWNFDWDEIK